MDELDKKLYHDMRLDVPIPDKCRTIIRESLYDERKIKGVYYHSLAKVVLTTFIVLLITTGIVYAGTKVYEKIFKNPEKVIGFYFDNNYKKYLNEENDTAVSKENAIDIANNLLKKFSHENEKIEKIELLNNSENYQLIWCAKTNKNNSIEISADNASTYNIIFNNIIEGNITKSNKTIEKVEAINIAKELCSSYGYDTNDYTYIRAYTNSSSNLAIWYIDFFKEYEGIVNPFQKINIGFIPEINEVYVFGIHDAKFDNNLVDINSQQAKEIALDKEKKININYEIENISSELCIVSTNDNAYLRASDYEQYYKQGNTNYPIEKMIEYRVSRHIRRAWVVTINYMNTESDSIDLKNNCFSYFIDATTGEIIGGDDNYNITRKLILE